jgi:hypothetical protein
MVPEEVERMSDEEPTDPPLSELVGGPLDGQLQVIRATRLMTPITDASLRWWMEYGEPGSAPPRWRFAVYEVEAPTSLADSGRTRYTFRGFE